MVEEQDVLVVCHGMGEDRQTALRKVVGMFVSHYFSNISQFWILIPSPLAIENDSVGQNVGDRSVE